jgi:hypothetical protein
MRLNDVLKNIDIISGAMLNTVGKVYIVNVAKGKGKS